MVGITALQRHDLPTNAATRRGRQRGLTRRPTGRITAAQLGQVGGTRYIFANRAKPPCRAAPVNSNVRPRLATSVSHLHTARQGWLRRGDSRQTPLSFKSPMPMHTSGNSATQCNRIRSHSRPLTHGQSSSLRSSQAVSCVAALPAQGTSLRRQLRSSIVRRATAARPPAFYSRPRPQQLQGTPRQGQQRGAGSHRGAQTRNPTPAWPNPSVNRSTNGRPPSPGRWYTVHFHRPGLGVLPLVPGYLQR